jgi:hypothetical protein
MSKVASDRPLSALLSQVLVAFTVELDDEFERRMAKAGYAGARLSLMIWSNLMRFLADGGVSVSDLANKALTSREGVCFPLGCLERWVFIALRPDSTDKRPIPMKAHRLKGRELRDGWGSGRGIRAEWNVVLTTKGRKAAEIWPSLIDEIEKRWDDRYSNGEIERLRESLQAIVVKLDRGLPDALPNPRIGGEPMKYPTSVTRDNEKLPLPALLSRLLLAFTIEFERESRTPLGLSANTIRVLGPEPVPLADIPRLTGCSPEMSDVGWQVKPYVVVTSDPNREGKVVRLSPLGARARQTYQRLVNEIEKQWDEKFGRNEIRNTRLALLELFKRENGNLARFSKGMVPPNGVARAGHQAPALGRRDVGAAARQRMRDLVAQTEAFVADPANALPHYPLWDMNRGFGP